METEHVPPAHRVHGGAEGEGCEDTHDAEADDEEGDVPRGVAGEFVVEVLATIELPNAAILMGAGAYATHLVANATSKPHAMSEPSSPCKCPG